MVFACKYLTDILIYYIILYYTLVNAYDFTVALLKEIDEANYNPIMLSRLGYEYKMAGL